MRTGASIRLFPALLALLILAAFPVPAHPRDAESLAPAPIDFVVLVDESGSLSTADVAAERAAASVLALGEVSDRSRVAVVGFGSVTRQGQAPVDTVCPMTRLDAAGREQLSSCVSKLHARTDAEGNGTDFPAALTQGLSLLSGTGENTPKIMFLLTDGRLDVSDSPAYGADPASRNANGTKALAQKVAQARSDKVQIWPLGFGSGIDRQQLDALAAGGYQSRCAELPSARPTAHVTAGSSDVSNVLLTAFAGARCARTTPGQTVEPVDSGADLHVTIPPVATDGSIEVVKQNPGAVAVTYYDPRGRKVPLQGSAYGSAFELVGQSGPVEALRIRNPYPGTWRVHVQVLDGASAQRITATAIWQGVLRSYILVDPPVPTAGQQVTAHVTLQTRQGVVLTEPEQLAGIKVSVRLTGKGFPPLTVALADDGRAPDARAHDGEFSAHITVPNTATGTLSFTGVMVGEGIAGDQRPYSTELATSAPLLTGAILFEDRQVHPGGIARGSVELRNQDSSAHHLRLAWTGGSAQSSLTVGPQQMTVAAGQTVHVPMRLVFGKSAALGAVPGSLTLRDEASEQVVQQAFVTVRVVPVPDFMDRYGKAVGAAAALVLALLVLLGLRWQDRRRARDTSDIQLILYRDDTELSRLRAPAHAGREFGFAVRAGAGGVQRLLLDDSGSRHRVRRTADGGLSVRLPGGERVTVPRGRRAPIADGLSLGFADQRPAARAAAPARAGRGTRGQDRPTASGRVRRSRGHREAASHNAALSARRPYDDDF
ncbi:vWA domain-containing protein [Streptomyces sp. Li-HN-5-11]|uniref:vWA domain-containing protein n=1 Tax=Streptomyces sp. Li-HN-5-11 TaxID=3075432 RepID=UPI0028A69366|nr:vWA domain-containing protein [Streptomyces sp. Li-HN-5-11]WNM31553.1 vWA domain-containing protein [Streptomyces sp. Li-HN-5-11]